MIIRYYSIRKNVNFIIILICQCFIVSIFTNLKLFDILCNRYFIGIFTLRMIFTCRNYKVEFLKSNMNFKSYITSISVDYKEVENIELVSRRIDRKRYAQKIYIYTNNDIHEYSITYFNVKELMSTLINICASNNLKLNVDNLRFDGGEWF